MTVDPYDNGGVDNDAAEMYLDAVSGRMRRRRGPNRRIKRGPYSREEDAMIKAFDLALSAERRMHGELAQSTCVDLTVLLVAWREVVERYSYENVPDVSGVSPHVVFEEMDMDVPRTVEPDHDEFDLGQLR